jgi:hypothetical protein
MKAKIVWSWEATLVEGMQIQTTLAPMLAEFLVVERKSIGAF